MAQCHVYMALVSGRHGWVLAHISVFTDSVEVSKSHIQKESTRQEDNSHFFLILRRTNLTVSNRIQPQEKVAIRLMTKLLFLAAWRPRHSREQVGWWLLICQSEKKSSQDVSLLDRFRPCQLSPRKHICFLTCLTLFPWVVSMHWSITYLQLLFMYASLRFKKKIPLKIKSAGHPRKW